MIKLKNVLLASLLLTTSYISQTYAADTNDETAVELQINFPQPDLSASSGQSTQTFYFDIPEWTHISFLRFSTSGGSGDADMFVNHESTPSKSSYECKSDGPDNNETCYLDTPTPGRWYVKLIAYSSFDDVTLTFNLDNAELCEGTPPHAQANGPYIGVAGTAIEFSSNGSWYGGTCPYPDSYIWNFGDGNISYEQNPSHTYTEPGVYHLELSVGGELDTTTVTVFEPPTFTVNPNGPYTGMTDEAIQFSSAGSSSSSGGDIHYLWDFGDGNTSNLANPYHMYYEEGNYTVTLTLSDNAGNSSSSTTTTANIEKNCWGAAPIAFANGPYTGKVGEAVQFSSAGSHYGGSCPREGAYHWTFGDGNSSNEDNPTHIYTEPGTYTATLTAAGHAYDSATVTISPAGIADACNNSAEQSYVYLQDAAPVCVAASNGGYHYFYFYNTQATSATVTSQHGDGNVTLYYGKTNWPAPWAYTQISANTGNDEKITIDELGYGWQYIMLQGNHNGVSLQLDYQ